MMESAAQILSGILIAAGAFFYVVGAIGMYRMPDVFTRMHATSISDTAGAGLLILGMMIAGGFTLVTAKLAIIMGVILFTGPVATHALAQAAMHANVMPLLAGGKAPAKPARPASRKPAGSSRKPSGKAAARKPASRRRTAAPVAGARAKSRRRAR